MKQAGPRTTGATMAKKQRTIQLPEEIFAITDVIEEKAGTKFNRLILAAMLQYLFSDVNGPATGWMELAVRLEKGAISLRDVPLEHADVQLLVAQVNAGAVREAVEKKKRPAQDLEEAERELADVRLRIKHWEHVVGPEGADAVPHLVASQQPWGQTVIVRQSSEDPSVDAEVDLDNYKLK